MSHYKKPPKKILVNRSREPPTNVKNFRKLSRKMTHLCIVCKKFVNSRQEALLCDGCNKWQHRKCNSGVSRDVYRKAVRDENDIPWKCSHCATSQDTVLPNFESTRNEGNYENHCFQVFFMKRRWHS